MGRNLAGGASAVGAHFSAARRDEVPRSRSSSVRAVSVPWKRSCVRRAFESSISRRRRPALHRHLADRPQRHPRHHPHDLARQRKAVTRWDCPATTNGTMSSTRSSVAATGSPPSRPPVNGRSETLRRVQREHRAAAARRQRELPARTDGTPPRLTEATTRRPRPGHRHRLEQRRDARDLAHPRRDRIHAQRRPHEPC